MEYELSSIEIENRKPRITNKHIEKKLIGEIDCTRSIW